jgi:hypothetical protein
MDKIINEFKVIETEDGFRIEIKGDKDKIRSFISSFGGHKGWPRWYRRRWSADGGPFGFHPDMWMQAAVCCGPWEFGAEEGE